MAEKTFLENEQTLEEIDHIGDCLKDAKAYGLELEVITWALKIMKRNPELSVKQAFSAAMAEWDI